MGNVSYQPVMAPLVRSSATRGWSIWQRRLLEAGVGVLAFAIWGKLAYVGGIRIIARLEHIPLRGPWILDALSLVIGVSGSIAGISALVAVGMRIAGRTPASLFGAPDDAPDDDPRSHPRNPAEV